MTSTSGAGPSNRSSQAKATSTPLALAFKATASAQKGSMSTASAWAAPDVDVICAGDICYAWPLADRARRWLEAAHAAGRRVLIGDPGRAYLPREGLKPLAAYEVATTRELEDREVRRTGVFTFGA